MIVKKVTRKAHKRTSRPANNARAIALGRYIAYALPENVRVLSEHEDDSYARALGVYAASGERILSVVARNLGSTSLSQQLAEIRTLVSSVPSGDNLVDHWVISWDAEDTPTIAEQEDAFRLFNECMGFEHCPSILGLHGDTDNPHGHELVLRIDPSTRTSIAKPHDGWDIDAAHKAIAVIQNHYPQWRRAPDRLYEVQHGRLVHRATGTDVGEAKDPGSWQRAPTRREDATSDRLLKKIDSVSLQYEQDTGLHSRKRIAVMEVVPLLLAADNWNDAHRRLADIGIELAKSKNNAGINFEIDGKRVKGSIHDRTALAPLEKRWGAFEPRDPSVTVAPFVPRLMHPKDAKRAQYHSERSAFSSGIAQIIAEVRASDANYSSTLPSAEYDPAKLCRLAAPTFEAWVNGASFPSIESVFVQAPRVSGIRPMSIVGGEVRHEGFRSERRETGTAYYQVYNPYARPAVFDAGKRVYVNDDSDASILLALRIAVARSNGKAVHPFGPPEFLARVAVLARSENIAIAPHATETVADRCAKAPVAPLSRVRSQNYDKAVRKPEPAPPSDGAQKAAKAQSEWPSAPLSKATPPVGALEEKATLAGSKATAPLTIEQLKALEAQRNQGWGR